MSMSQPVSYGTSQQFIYPQAETPPGIVASKNASATSSSGKTLFIGVGTLLLSMLCLIPVWNAMALLQDNNYIFWTGQTVPLTLLLSCITLVLLYVVTITSFFKYGRAASQTEQTIMMIANIFITLLGLVLMLVSLPLSRESAATYDNLMHRCDYSEQTHRIYEYSQVLHNIRRDPACASEFSVETCQGYKEAAPYTSMLKSMEEDFRCSGFCYRGLSNTANQTAASSPVAKAESTAAPAGTNGPQLIQTKFSRSRNPDTVSSSSTAGLLQLRNVEFAKSRYPPTLFSDANYQASCEGMAARDMKNFAGDIGFQTFYQGIYLVLIAIATGFLKLIGLCVKKDDRAGYDGVKGR